MADEVQLNSLELVRKGYERFFNNTDNRDNNDKMTVSLHRQEEFTTVSSKNKIKISLSQEQIIKSINATNTGIRRSQSINIERTTSGVWNRGQSIDINRRYSFRKPSQIPVKIYEPSRLPVPMLSSAKNGNRSEQTIKRATVNVSDSNRDRLRFTRKYANQLSDVVGSNEMSLSSLPCIKFQPSITETYSETQADKSGYQNLLPDKFKCSICLGAFNDPRVLQCLHTFCLECLYDIEIQSKGGIGKVNLVLGHNSRENSEMDSIGDSNKVDGSTAETCCDAKDSSRRQSTSAIGGISSSNIKKLITSTIKKRSEERKSSIAPSKRCLSVSTEKYKTVIRCPICLLKTEIPIGGVSRVLKDYLLERQIRDELMRLEQKSLMDHSCGLCYDNTAVCHCMNCKINLCKICKEAHLRQRSTSKHNVESLVEATKQLCSTYKEERAASTKTILKCFVHPAQELKLFCTTCDQVACHNCTILLHKGHKFEPLLRATKSNLKSINESLERNLKFHSYLNDSINKLANSVKIIDQRADIMQREIEEFLQDYFDALKAHKETLLRQIAKAKETKYLAIMEQQEYLEKRAAEAKEANDFAENLLKNGTDAEIMTFVGTLQHRFEHCQKSKTSIDPKIPDAFRFLPEIRAPATQAQHNIPLYGIIATQVADPKFCTLDIEGPIIFRIHRRAEVRMISRDSDERPLCHGGLILFVQVKHKDVPLKKIVTQVNDKRDGSYIIAFTPDTVGELSLTIKVQDRDIKGSPFTVSVRALRPHSGIFHCCTFCSSKGSKTATCACESKMSGGYLGCGHGHEGHPGRRHWSCCASVLETSECSATNSFR